MDIGLQYFMVWKKDHKKLIIKYVLKLPSLEDVANIRVLLVHHGAPRQVDDCVSQCHHLDSHSVNLNLVEGEEEQGNLCFGKYILRTSNNSPSGL